MLSLVLLLLDQPRALFRRRSLRGLRGAGCAEVHRVIPAAWIPRVRDLLRRGLGHLVWGVACVRVQGAGFGVWGPGFEVWSSGFGL